MDKSGENLDTRKRTEVPDRDSATHRDCERDTDRHTDADTDSESTHRAVASPLSLPEPHSIVQHLSKHVARGDAIVDSAISEDC